jgi:alanine-synthesizing transaminase
MLEHIAEIARRHNLVVFSDEIYDKLILEDTPHIAFAAVAPDVPCITFGGMSKNYLVPGWRIGWGIVSGDAAAVTPYTEGVHRLLAGALVRQSSGAVCDQGRRSKVRRIILWKCGGSCARVAT